MVKKYKLANRIMAIICGFALITPGLPAYLEHTAQAEIPSSTLNLSNKITDWVIDNDRGNIYAISKESNKLFVIDKDQMTLETTLSTGSQPNDIELAGNELYIALSGEYAIQKMQLNDLTKEEKITTLKQPYLLTSDRERIVYTPYVTQGVKEIYSINRDTNIETVLQSPENLQLFWAKNIALHTEKGILYGPNFALDINTLQLKANNIIVGERIVADGEDVFVGNRKLSADRPDVIIGTYEVNMYTDPDQDIITVNNRYVATNHSVYDRNTYSRVDVFSSLTDLVLLDNVGHVYYIPRYTNQLVKQTIATNDPVQPVKEGNSIILNSKVLDWVATDAFIYAITADNNLYTIRKEDMSVVDQKFVGSSPTDIELYEDKLYVALSGSSTIGVVDIVYGNLISHIAIPTTARKVLVKGDQLVYASPLTVVDMVYGNSYQPKATSQPNEVESPITGDAMLLDPVNNRLYVTEYDGNHLYVLDAATYEKVDFVLQLGNLPFSSTAMVLDGTELYYAGVKRDVSNLQAVQATFSEDIIYVDSPYAFARYSVYDSNTGKVLFNLPFAINEVNVEEDGTLYVSEFNPYEMVDHLQRNIIHKFTSIDEFKKYAEHSTRALDAMFVDTSVVSGKISGKLYILPPPVVATALQEYRVFFNNEAGMPVGDNIAGYCGNRDSAGVISCDIQGEVPEQAVYLGIYAVNRGTNKPYNPIQIILWDTPKYLPRELKFIDEDPQSDKVAGKITFLPPEKELSAYEYHFHFVSEDDKLGDSLGSVKAGSSSYAFTVPKNTTIPAGAIGITITVSLNGEEAPYVAFTPLQDRTSVKLNANNISVNNRPAGQQDTVVVNGLQLGDRIFVYNAYGQPIGEGLVEAGSSITINVHELGNSEGYVYVTVQRRDMMDSDPTKVNHSAPSSGNSGGFIGGGGGGMFLMPLVAPEPELVEDTVKITLNSSQIIKEKGDDGKEVTKAIINEEMIEKSLKLIEKEKFTNESKLLINIPENVENLQVEIAASSIIKARQNNEDMVIIVQLSNSSYSLPLKIIDPKHLEENLQSRIEDIGLQIRMRKVDENSIITNAETTGMKLISDLIDFNVVAKAGDKEVIINDFGNTYVKRSITVNRVLNSNETAAVYYDLASRTFSFVPAILSAKDGKTEVTMKRNGNSIYAIVESKKNFVDVRDHWAQREIELLASKFIITGTTPTTFAPEDAVTRAQFAALIVRALGLVTAQALTNFSDVHDTDWYANVIATAAKFNLIEGFEDGTFRPNESVTGEQSTVILHRALAIIDNERSSAENVLSELENVSDWAKASVEALMNAKIIMGQEDAAYSGRKSLNRAQTAVILERMLRYAKFIN
ncbi:hypothetical protein GC096_05945 [Paenibacillus sp. LMG 31461]|uniref:SLH domain-containing protein n=1 Tax=Paenibacillus plantarum TaxID=2654975 RepID=A0ABX1X5I0_9BACL|nr:S-layer homology domain-containing protein [Paenibacillus plantarum]NOU63564.1 hypothetical protein [Paenibacillus plantarum]